MHEPKKDPIRVSDVETAYRGINFNQKAHAERRGFFAPEEPLPFSSAELTMFSSRVPRNHVLSYKRNHMVSFSLQRGTAVWYATQGGRQDGFLVEVSLPSEIEVTIDGSSEPASFVGNDATQWIDPRHLFVDANLPEWDIMRARAIADQELLLFAGRVALKNAPTLVRRTEALLEFQPWQDMHEAACLVCGAIAERALI